MSSVEHAIKQTKPMSPQQKGLINILLTHNFVSTKMQEFLDIYEVTIPQFNVLRILRGQYPKTCGNALIKERMLYKNTDVTRLVDRLVQKGFVDRCQGKDDRRRVEIAISKQGLNVLTQIDLNFEQLTGILRHLSSEEIRNLNNTLDKIRQCGAPVF